jgi:hypothetical protein
VYVGARQPVQRHEQIDDMVVDLDRDAATAAALALPVAALSDSGW